jgi:hypothetical protein
VSAAGLTAHPMAELPPSRPSIAREGLAVVGWALHARRLAANRSPGGAEECPEVTASTARMLSAARKVLEIEAPSPTQTNSPASPTWRSRRR